MALQQRSGDTSIIPPTNALLPVLDEADLAELALARECLEHRGLAVRLSRVLGSPLEAGVRRMPPGWQETFDDVARAAVERSLAVALYSLGTGAERAPPRRGVYRLLGGATGAMGGAFGLASLIAELPVTTTLMLRGIGHVARGEGEDLASPETRLACLEVFAIGSGVPSEEGADSSYFGARLALFGTGAGRHLALQGLALDGPALTAVMNVVSRRFAKALSERAVARLVPVIGAFSGAAVNVAFMAHFQSVAQGHFSVRRLERRYGGEAVRRAYESLA